MGQGISAGNFFVYGKRHFTKKGYLKHIQDFDAPVQAMAGITRGAEGADGVDLEGKTVVVTGANKGIGKELATYAAAKGACVYMLCRSKGRAEAARDEIVKQTSNQDVRVLLADVGELAQVRKVVQEFQSKEEKIDCLVCNAGVLLNERQETSEGNEATFASHFVGGTYLLSKLLMPQLRKAGSEARVVIVTSGGMYSTPFPSWGVATDAKGSGNKYDGTMAYAYAKRGQVLFAERWAKENPEVACVTVHPGWSDTDAVKDAFGSASKWLQPLRTAWEGAEGITWLMSTPRKKLESGAFYLDRRPQKKHLAGPFMTEGSFTKNTEQDVDEIMENLRLACGPDQ